MTSQVFLEKANKIHNSKYTYNVPDVINKQSKIEIICPIHGNFFQSENIHLRNHGCPKCGIESRIKKQKKWTSESFISYVSKLLPDIDFSLAKFESFDKNLICKCSIHGIFLKPPAKLLKKKGCNYCSGAFLTRYSKTNISKVLCVGSKISKQKWIDRFNLKHQNKYDYSLLPEKFLAKDKVNIVCPIHGKYEQIVQNHKKAGCHQCAKISISQKNKKNSNRGWTYTNWENAAKQSKYFDSFKVYIIKCYNENETFYKVGKTFMTIKKRFKSKINMPYKFEIIKIFESKTEAKKISMLEHQILSLNKNDKYVPKIYFKGINECFKSMLTFFVAE